MMRTTIVALLVLIHMTMQSAALAQPVADFPEPDYSGETTEITVDLTVHGYGAMLRNEDETCVVGFMGMPILPYLQVNNEEDEVVSVTPLFFGETISIGDESYACQQGVSVEIPKSGDFTLIVAPLVALPYTQDDVEAGVLVVDYEREKDAPFAVLPFPTPGPIEGTDDVRILGFIELKGEFGEDFLSLPPISCRGMGGYSDIAPGMQLTVSDETRTIIGVTETQMDPTVMDPERCAFYFVAEVPASSFYVIETGRRGDMTYSHDDLESRDWTVSLTLGR